MDPTHFIQKQIDGVAYVYDRRKDIVFTGHYNHALPYDRTQVERAVDLCVELSTHCNLSCENCFSNSAPSAPAEHADVSDAVNLIKKLSPKLIRVTISGGEPLLHPQVDQVLVLPAQIRQCGFVLSTNGTARLDLDDLLVGYSWLVAVSLNGHQEAHNKYTKSRSFKRVVSRIENLATRTVVHVYCVLNDHMTEKDVMWLYDFRNQANIAFLRFMIPRNFGRYKPLQNVKLIDAVCSRLDERSGLKTKASLTRFRAVDGTVRYTN